MGNFRFSSNAQWPRKRRKNCRMPPKMPREIVMKRHIYNQIFFEHYWSVEPVDQAIQYRQTLCRYTIAAIRF